MLLILHLSVITGYRLVGYLKFIYISFVLHEYTVFWITVRFQINCLTVNFKCIGPPCLRPHLWGNIIKDNPNTYKSSWTPICKGWRTMYFSPLYTEERQSFHLPKRRKRWENKTIVLVRFDGKDSGFLP